MKYPKNLELTLAMSVALASAGVHATTITADTTIGVNDPSYEGQDIVVSGCTLTINGSHAFNRLTVSDGGMVTHSPVAPGETNNRVNLTIAQDVLIASDSKIDVSFKGYNAALPGPGAGAIGTIGGDWGSGGAYGGFGADSVYSGAKGGQPYGSVTQPADWGSAGGPCPSHGGVARSGGGAVRLVVGGTLNVSGQIVANGDSDYETSADQEVGGGAGGSIWLTAGILTGTGTIIANGGAGDMDADGGGGGGGRIALYYGSSSFNGAISAQGSACSFPGGAGTIFTKSASQATGSVLVDNGGLIGVATGIGSSELFSLTVTNGGIVVAQAAMTLSGLHVATNGMVTTVGGGSNLNLTVLGDAVIDQGASITVDGKGYPVGSNHGPGTAPDDYSYAGGAGYAGEGGLGYYGAPRGSTYGSLMQPVDLGSAGGTGAGDPGSAGGGAMRLVVGGTLTLNGTISANGIPETPGHGGCGSGGSLWITAGTLQGLGSFSANGGSGRSNCDGGAGGGGRIAIYFTNAARFNFGEQAFALGGGPFGCPNLLWGGAGTIYLKDSTKGVGDLLIQNGGHQGARTPLALPEPVNLMVADNALVNLVDEGTVTDLHLATNGVLTAASSLALMVLGNATIDPGGWLTLDGKGYPIGSYRGPGTAPDSFSYAGGAGYAGEGGLGYYGARGGPAYGSLMQPVDFGSAGGTGAGEPGSAGGGAIRFNVEGTLTLNGRISANGISDTPGHGGCGSGGSVWLTCGTLQGSGSVSANGGSGRSDCDGGAGGGGRVAIYYSNASGFSLSNQVFAMGGGPFNCPNTLWGGAGTIYLKDSSRPVGDLLINNGGNLGALTPLTSPEPFNLTISGNATVSPSGGLTLSTLHLCTNSFLALLAGNSSLDVLVLDNGLIDQGAVMNADAKGYSFANQGPGAAPENGSYAGGGGYGGLGGTGYYGAPGGPTYGSLTQPVDLGSAGGTGSGEPGSAGGGAIRFTVMGTLLHNGIISANGGSFTPGHGGCGSGGSIWLTAGALTGSGLIAADGGTGRSDCDGGGGGGGRIALYYHSAANFDLVHQLSASGGGPFTCATFGQTGTVYSATATPTLAILSSLPNDQLPRPYADYIDLVFNQAVNPATLTSEDVTVLTPSGQLAASQLTINNAGGTRWRIAFPPQTVDGSYQYTVGPHIANLDGIEMAGSYSGSFVLKQSNWPKQMSFTTTPSSLQLGIPSLRGLSYRVLRSSDLVHWQSLGPATPGDGNILNWILPAVNTPAAFFRLQIEDSP